MQKIAEVHFALLLGLFLIAQNAFAVTLMDGKMQVHGFISQGMVHTSANRFAGESDDGVSLNLRDVGVNLSLRPTADLQFSGQVISHRVGEINNGHLKLDYGLVDWTPFSGEWGKTGLRVGRIKLPYGLYAETRDMPFTRSGVILPQSVYFEATRNLQVSADGIALYHERNNDAGTFGFNYTLGYPRANDKSTVAMFFGMQRQGDLNSKPAHILNATYDDGGGNWRLSMTAAYLDLKYKPGVDEMPSGDGKITLLPIGLSAQYNADKWSITTEYMQQHLTFRNLGPFLPGTLVSESYYIRGAYRPSPKWEVFLGYDAFINNKEDRKGKAYTAFTGLPAAMSFTKDWTTGVRYDVNESFMLRAELHHINGASWLSPLENPDPFRLEQHWNMIMLLAAYRF